MRRVELRVRGGFAHQFTSIDYPIGDVFPMADRES